MGPARVPLGMAFQRLRGSWGWDRKLDIKLSRTLNTNFGPCLRIRPSAADAPNLPSARMSCRHAQQPLPATAHVETIGEWLRSISALREIESPSDGPILSSWHPCTAADSNPVFPQPHRGILWTSRAVRAGNAIRFARSSQPTIDTAV